METILLAKSIAMLLWGSSFVFFSVCRKKNYTSVTIHQNSSSVMPQMILNFMTHSQNFCKNPYTLKPHLNWHKLFISEPSQWHLLWMRYTCTYSKRCVIAEYTIWNELQHLFVLKFVCFSSFICGWSVSIDTVLYCDIVFQSDWL